MVNAGCRFLVDDLTHFQWLSLTVLNRVLNEKEIEEMERINRQNHGGI